jgi:hypothetical protein
MPGSTIYTHVREDDLLKVRGDYLGTTGSWVVDVHVSSQGNTMDRVTFSLFFHHGADLQAFRAEVDRAVSDAIAKANVK